MGDLNENKSAKPEGQLAPLALMIPDGIGVEP